MVTVSTPPTGHLLPGIRPHRLFGPREALTVQPGCVGSGRLSTCWAQGPGGSKGPPTEAGTGLAGLQTVWGQDMERMLCWALACLGSSD